MRVLAMFMVLLCGSISAADVTSEKELSDLLSKWTESWNKRDIVGLINLHHKDSKLRKAFDSSPEAKDGISKEFSEMIKQFGDIKSANVGKFIERKSRYVIKINYATKGLIPGTMSLKQDADGNWAVLDFNLDGQGEPELKQ